MSKGINTPYGSSRSGAKRITNSAITERLRAAIGEPHISMSVPIASVYPGNNPPNEMLDTVKAYRDFTDDGLANPRSGLMLSAVQRTTTVGDFETAIENWYSSAGWTVIKDV
jgi:hypothetical protein